MRAVDVAELAASSDKSPLECLQRTTSAPGESYVASGPDGVPFGVFGLVTAYEGVAVPWMLCTDAFAQYGRECDRLARKTIRRWAAQHPRLLNFVDARSVGNIKWLKSLGFTVGPPEIEGCGGHYFCRFEGARKDFERRQSIGK